jgi:hypothetical protein
MESILFLRNLGVKEDILKEIEDDNISNIHITFSHELIVVDGKKTPVTVDIVIDLYEGETISTRVVNS